MSSFFRDRALQDEIDVSTDGEEDSEDSSVTENVVRLEVLHDDFKPMLSTSIQELRRAGLKIDCFSLRENAQEATSTKQTSTPNKQCLAPSQSYAIDTTMKKLQFCVYRGDVFKKVPETQFTLKFLCSMKTFLLNLMGNKGFRQTGPAFSPSATTVERARELRHQPAENRPKLN